MNAKKQTGEFVGKASRKMLLKNEFSWSKSSDELFRECQRKYYYQKYGSWGGWDWEADERTRQLYILKNLKSRHMWLGEKLHEEIAYMLKTLRSGQQLNSDKSLERIRVTMRKEFMDSKKKLYRKDPKRFLGLFEHEYEINLSDERWRELPQSAKKCLEGFVNSKEFQAISKIQEKDWLPIEKFQEMRVNGIKIYLKIDFAYRFEDLTRIVDWKTGESKDADSAVQMGCYCLFAKEEWHQEERYIESREVNIRTGSTKVNRIESEAELDWVEHYIRNSANAMLDLLDDRDNNVAKMEKFKKTKDETKCRWCNFRKVCELE